MGLRMVNRVRDALGGEHLSLVVVFEAPTVRQMAKMLQDNYPAAVQRWLGDAAGGDVAEPAAQAPRRPAGEEDVARLRVIIGQVAPPDGAARGDADRGAAAWAAVARAGAAGGTPHEALRRDGRLIPAARQESGPRAPGSAGPAETGGDAGWILPSEHCFRRGSPEIYGPRL